MSGKYDGIRKFPVIGRSGRAIVYSTCLLKNRASFYGWIYTANRNLASSICELTGTTEAISAAIKRACARTHYYGHTSTVSL